MNMRFCFGRVSTLVCFFLLLFSGGVLFAKPGDYLVCTLDPQKDSLLRCCCCEREFAKDVHYPSLCFLKYEEGGDTETVFKNAKEFNLHEAGKIRSRFFEVVKSNDYYSVVKELKIVLNRMKGLFCDRCIKSAFKVTGIFEWEEFLAPHVEARYDGNILSNCDVCGKKLLNLSIQDIRYCNKCDTHIGCDSCYFEDLKGRIACPICNNKVNSNNKIMKRRIPYLLDKDIQKTSDNGTEIRPCLRYGCSASSSIVFNYGNLEFVVYSFFPKNEKWFESEIKLSEEEKKCCYDIPGTTGKFHFVCCLETQSENGISGWFGLSFRVASEEAYKRYDKRWYRYAPKWGETK